MTNLRQLPIVMISMSRWDGDFSSAAWSLAKTFAKNQPVIYVDYPYTLLDYFRERKKATVIRRKPALWWGKNSVNPLNSFGKFLYALTPRLMIPVNWLPKGQIYRFLAGINDRILASDIKRGLKSLGMNEFLFFNSFNPLYLSKLPKGFDPAFFIYQSRDNIRALEPYLRKHGATAEIQAIKEADLSIVTSRQLQADLTHLSGRTVHYLPNAAEFDTFKRAFLEKIPMPADLAEIPGPLIGYTGNICHRSNYPLLAKICEVHADKSFVMIGPRNHWSSTDIDLDAIPNLYFLGPKPIERLPDYLAHFDVLILPFLINEVTKSIYPLKINEYLASGKPVVATPFSEDIKAFGGVIRLEESPEKFASAISEELKYDNAEKRAARHAVASENTWDNRTKEIWQMVENSLSSKQSG
ncbi:glycosyltransferase [Lunatimonas salinarum]|uniref:glycosyltransferase n=1 Tax=Lunatimonas salinarum TaxID=1774590 RepID=UPI001FD7A374|nr:glycosyltransferase [Lunatimonas salinarum]